MSEPRLESYPWYLDDWFRSETRAAMTLSQRGLYRELIDLCWAAGSLPNDFNLIRTMSQVDSKSFASCIEVVIKEFYLIDGRYHHRKVDEKRNELIERKLERSESGRKGGLAKAQLKAQPELSSSSRARSPSPSPSPSPTTNPLNPPDRKETAEMRFEFDETYQAFRAEFTKVRPDLVDEDFKGIAWSRWRILDGLQRIERLNGLRERIRRGDDPAYFEKPEKMIESGYKRAPRPHPNQTTNGLHPSAIAEEKAGLALAAKVRQEMQNGRR